MVELAVQCCRDFMVDKTMASTQGSRSHSFTMKKLDVCECGKHCAKRGHLYVRDIGQLFRGSVILPKSNIRINSQKNGGGDHPL